MEKDCEGEQHWLGKLIIVGEGGTGKTSMVHRLIGGSFFPDQNTTHGIQVTELNMPHPVEKATMRLNIWDFGGQQIFHATPQVFLTEGSLVLLTWNARLGYEQGRLDFWLASMAHRVPNVPILLVGTHVDERSPSIPFSQLKNKYPNICGQVAISAKTGLGIMELVETIALVASKLPTMGRQLPTAWKRVTDTLDKLSSETPFLSLGQLTRLFADNGLEKKADQRELARYLHMIGKILWFGDNPRLKERVVLDFNQLVLAMGSVLEGHLVADEGGLLRRNHLKHLWREIPEKYHHHLLAYLEAFDLVFPTHDKETVGIVLQQAPLEGPDLQEKRDSSANNRKLNLLFEFESDIPPGIHLQIIGDTGYFTKSRFWRHGAMITDQGNTAKMLLWPHKRLLELEVQGPDPKTLFQLLHTSLESALKRYPELRVARTIPCRCSVQPCSNYFPLEAVERAAHRRMIALQCPVSFEKVKIERLLAGFERNGQGTGHVLETSDQREVQGLIPKTSRNTLFEKGGEHLPFSIKQISIEGFQCIKKAGFNKIQTDCQWIFFIGENGDGKTSLLQALTIGMCGAELARPLLPQGSETCAISVEYQRAGQSKLRHFHWPQTKVPASTPPSNFLAYGPSRLRIQNEDSDADTLQSIKSPIANLLLQKGNLQNIELWFKNKQLEAATHKDAKVEQRIEEVKNLLVRLMPHVDDLVFEGADIYYLEKGNRVPIHHLSAGHKSVLAMVGDMIIRLYEQQPKVVTPADFEGIMLIDELENHLHPKWQAELPHFLSSLFPKIQFFATTHSPLVFIGAPKKSRFFLVTRTPKGGTKVNPIKIDVSKLLPEATLRFLFGLERMVNINEDPGDVFPERNPQDIEFSKMLSKKLREVAGDDEQISKMFT